MSVLSITGGVPSDGFRAGGIIYREARHEDDECIRSLLRNNDMDSWVRMSIEREPSFFLGENVMGQSMAVLARHSNPPHEVVGMYSMAGYKAHINGSPSDTGYLGALRVNPGYRHKLRILKNGFASARALSGIGKLPVFTSLASENHTARRLLEANLRGMPSYTPIGELESLGISTAHGKNTGLLRAAQPKDIPALVEFFNIQAATYHFSPVLDEQWLKSLSGDFGLQLNDFLLLEDGSTLRGCIAVWDQRAFKQVVPRGYRFPLNVLRPLYNLYARLAGHLVLPRTGHQLEQVFLSFLALDAQATDSFSQLIEEALFHARQKGAKAGVLGLSVENPLYHRTRENFHASVYRTCIETIAWPDSPGLQLEARPPQPEIGLL